MKKGVLDQFVRTREEELAFAEETAIAQSAIAIAELLDSSGVTQRELAERIGVTEARISQLLHAESNPTVRTLARIAEALGRRFRIEYVDTRGPTEEIKPWPGTGHLFSVRWIRSDSDEQVGVAEEVDAA